MKLGELIRNSEPKFRQHFVDKEAFKARLFEAVDAKGTTNISTIQKKVGPFRGLTIGLTGAAVLCGLVLVSGVVSPTLAQVLRQVPGVQSFYQMLGYDIGIQNSVREGYSFIVNHTVTRQGVSLTLTTVTVDQQRVSLSFAANVGAATGGIGATKFSANGKNIDGSEDGSFSYPTGQTLSVVNFRPSATLPERFNLGVTVHRVGHVHDTWNFVVPVNLKKVTDATRTINPNTTRTFGQSTVTVKQITLGPSSMVVDYVFTTPVMQMHRLDSMGIGQTVEDDQGRPIFASSWTTIGAKIRGNTLTKEYQVTYFGAPALSSKFLIMAPYQDVHHAPPRHITADLHGSLPITRNMGGLGVIRIESARFTSHETRVYYQYSGPFAFPLSLISVNNTTTAGVQALGNGKFVASFLVNATQSATVSTTVLSASDPIVETLMKVPLQ